MADNKHCPDHCEFFAELKVIASDVSYIKKKFEEQKADGKWLFGTIIAVCSLLYTYFK